ncbi:uncharacterized protein LOC126825610 isoform X2 [Patella vulgata]|nr:uncharacterized protein LOC126825610 isoform X2 [Patella vulgata]
MRCQQFCCLFYLLISWSIPTGICRSCIGATTYCEVGQTCWLYPPPNVTLKSSKFSLKVINTTTPVNIIHQNGGFTFTPTETMRAERRIVADFINSVNKTICSSTLIVLAKPVPVTRVSCNVQRKQQNNDISCEILDNITKNVTKVEIFPRNTGETKECVIKITDLVFRCSFDYKNRFLQHNISITVSNAKVNNTQPAVNHIHIYIFNIVEPKYLHNVTIKNDGCFSMNISAQPDDTYIPLNNTPLLFYLVITAKDIIILDKTVVRNETLVYNMKNKFFANNNYNISIKWKPVNGTKWSKVTSRLQQTDVCVPSLAPVAFKGGYSVTQKNKIAVYWKKIPKLYENGPDLEYEISRIQDKEPVEKKIVNGSKVSVLLNGSQQENEVLIVARNKKGSSHEKSSIKIPNQHSVKSRPSSLKFEPLNATHHRLSWTYSSLSSHDEFHFFWCYGIYRQSHNWVECKQEIYNQTVRNSSSTLSSSFYDILKPAEPEESCNNCSWNYGLSIIYEDIASPIVWDKTEEEIRIPSGNLTITTIVYLSIFIVIAILFIGYCSVYRCKRSKKKCCGTYDIIAPPLSEIYETKEMSTFTTDNNQIVPCLHQSEPNGNIATNSCDPCNANVDDFQDQDRPVIVIDVDRDTTNQTYYQSVSQRITSLV